MRQRAVIAMALSCNPSLLIADEPTTALDVTVQAQVLELSASPQAAISARPIVLITHDMGVVAEMADRVLVMYAGRVIERAARDAIFRDLLASLYLGPAQFDPTAGRAATGTAASRSLARRHSPAAGRKAVYSGHGAAPGSLLVANGHRCAAPASATSSASSNPRTGLMHAPTYSTTRIIRHDSPSAFHIVPGRRTASQRRRALQAFHRRQDDRSRQRAGRARRRRGFLRCVSRRDTGACR